MANNRFPLELLPDGVQLGIEQYLSPSDQANVAMVCKATLQNAKRLDHNGHTNKTLGIDFSGVQLHPFFNSRIHTMQKNLYQAGLYILTGKKDEALAMIGKDPGLLCQVIPTITLKKHAAHIGEKYAGRMLYQLALGTYDHELYEPIGERIKLKYGQTVQAKQFNEQFPNGVKSTKSYRVVFDSLIKTMAADPTIDFVDGQNIMNDQTKAALQALEDTLPKPTDERTTGVHLDLQIIIDLIDAYEEGNNEFTNEAKRWAQRALYWRCVFGLVEKHMPYFVAMALNELRDFFGVMEGKEKVRRSTAVEDDSDFFSASLGVSRYIIAWEIGRGSGLGELFVGGVGVKEFCRAHIKKLGDLKQHLQQSTNHDRQEIDHHRSWCQIV